jgi:hypothetical protein
MRPTTPQALAHLITCRALRHRQVIDSREFSRPPRPAAPTPDATQALRDAMLKYRPDVVLHIIATPEVRALANDLRVMSEIAGWAARSDRRRDLLVVVLSKPDIIGNPRECPRSATRARRRKSRKARLLHRRRPEHPRGLLPWISTRPIAVMNSAPTSAMFSPWCRSSR